MNKVENKNMKRVEEELFLSRNQITLTLDQNLENVKVHESELKELKEKLTQFPKFVQERRIAEYRINKQLHFVLQDADIVERIDKALEYINKVKKHHSERDA